MNTVHRSQVGHVLFICDITVLLWFVLVLCVFKSAHSLFNVGMELSLLSKGGENKKIDERAFIEKVLYSYSAFIAIFS